jgi:antibiotic biosynthesis monooxygenase (ABM) superfamily enzyme
MWLERGAQLVRASHARRVSGMDAWFGPARSAPPRWKQAISIWVVYFPTLLLVSVLFQAQLATLSVFWRVFLTTASMTPVLSFILIPLVTRLLHGWLHPGQPRPPAGRLARLLR